MKSAHQINIARDFSRIPLGRFPDDSEFNGTTFREKYLIPALTTHTLIEVDLDGTEGYGSSFLEEAFGGLVRLNNFDSKKLLTQISLVSEEDPTLIPEIRQYISEARPKRSDIHNGKT